MSGRRQDVGRTASAEATAFGRSLHIDCFGVPRRRCDDLAFCYRFLEDLALHLGMQAQAPPFLFRSPDAFPAKAGLSGWIPLIESGISIHTLIERGFVTIDVYTCGPLQCDATIDFVVRRFRAKRQQSQLIVRGLGYHDH
jgi:S-adenosylmethionine decarboxylase